MVHACTTKFPNTCDTVPCKIMVNSIKYMINSNHVENCENVVNHVIRLTIILTVN